MAVLRMVSLLALALGMAASAYLGRPAVMVGFAWRRPGDPEDVEHKADA